MLALTLGVSKLIVLVNKMDTCDWSRSLQTDSPKIGPVPEARGYKVKGVSWVSCSGLNGANIKDGVEAGIADWLPEKRSFLEVLDELPVGDRKPRRHCAFQFWINFPTVERG